MKIHCINLERAKERKEQILKDWNGYDIEFFPAVDRRDLNDDYDPTKSLKVIGRPLTPGERACCYSHAGVLKKFLNSKDEYAIVIEDDVAPIVSHQTFMDTLKKAKNIAKNGDIFILFAQSEINFYYQSRSIKGNIDFVYLKKSLWGTCGMLYTRNSAVRMIEYLQRAILPADGYWPAFSRENHIIICRNPIIQHIGEYSTYIEKDYRGFYENARIFKP